MIDLMNLVQSVDPKMLKAEMDKQGIPYINVKPLLNFIADKTNEKRPLQGSWYAVPTMCDIIGVSRSTLYKMRDAAERLGLVIVIEDPVETGERGKSSVLVLTTTFILYLSKKLFERIHGYEANIHAAVKPFETSLPAWWLADYYEDIFQREIEGYEPELSVLPGDGTVRNTDGVGPQYGRIPYALWTEWVRITDGIRPPRGAESEVEAEKECRKESKGKVEAGATPSTSSPRFLQGTHCCEKEEACYLKPNHLGVCKDSRDFPIDAKFHINDKPCEPYCNKGVGHAGPCFHEEYV
jgi:hypothetical protein